MKTNSPSIRRNGSSITLPKPAVRARRPAEFARDAEEAEYKTFAQRLKETGGDINDDFWTSFSNSAGYTKHIKAGKLMFDPEVEPVNPYAHIRLVPQPVAVPIAPPAPAPQPIVYPESPSPAPINHVEHLDIASFEVKPLFYMGVEFEGMVRAEALPAFKRSMMDLSYDERSGQSLIQFGTDASVKDVPPGYQAVEIRTSVVRSRVGVRLFEEMLCFLYVASQTDDWLTNESCGLHLNISERRLFDDGKQVDYYCQVLSLFDEEAVLETFGRTGNKYCLPFFKEGAARDLPSAKRLYTNLKRRERAAADRGDDKWRVHEGKYLAVSLRDSPQHDGYAGNEEANQRIEFRCIGNASYHLRFDELEETVNHMISVVRLAYREVMR